MYKGRLTVAMSIDSSEYAIGVPSLELITKWACDDIGDNETETETETRQRVKDT